MADANFVDNQVNMEQEQADCFFLYEFKKGTMQFSHTGYDHHSRCTIQKTFNKKRKIKFVLLQVSTSHLLEGMRHKRV